KRSDQRQRRDREKVIAIALAELRGGPWQAVGAAGNHDPVPHRHHLELWRVGWKTAAARDFARLCKKDAVTNKAGLFTYTIGGERLSSHSQSSRTVKWLQYPSRSPVVATAVPAAGRSFVAGWLAGWQPG